ncbi:DUF4058 family protein [Tautonia sp. JC769]|uniref:DUF4058 family protein n=1 Tax=Tautonia sp. JC769 TaxID=3232135 RepID=UPI00345AB3C9
MPMHDWTRVSPGIYHNFHQYWTIEISKVLNQGILPPGYFAMADQRVSGPEPDVIALKFRGPEPAVGLAVAEAPPRIRASGRAEIDAARYAVKANRLSVRDEIGQVVAIIEVVSPGNKDRQAAVSDFVGKAVTFLRNGVHLLMIDPFPAGSRDPEGLASAIWRALADPPIEPLPPGKPLAVASFDAGPPLTAYVEPIAVGDALPEAPLFLAPGWYVNVPLEPTYQSCWGQMPPPIQALVAPDSP